MQKLTAHDPETKSPDLIAENIEHLKVLFPEAFTEGKVDFEVLKQLLGGAVDEREEKYGLNWHGKRRARQIALTPSTGTLRPCLEDSVDWDTTRNLMIEGDNLEVLKLLQKSYAGKVKFIYIDQPYNTGKDFVYPDNYTEGLQTYLEYTGQVDAEGKKFSTNPETDGRFHSKWLNMMYPRLYLARHLLRPDGAIFISVDDQEQDNLKKVCNEIFGEENFVACLVNVNNPKGRSDDKFFPRAHEYVLVYQKGELKLRGLAPGEHILKRYNKRDEGERLYREIDLRKTGDNDRRQDRPNLFYYFHHNPETGELVPTREENAPGSWLSIKPLREDGEEGNWRWEMETAFKRLPDLQPKLMPVRKVWSVFEKDWLIEGERVKATTAWTQKEVNSERGTEQFVELGFPKEVFPRPKPVGLLCLLLELMLEPKSGEIVLDFFAGSGTTAQAALEMNSADGGNRRYILVQLPEPFDEADKADKAAADFCQAMGKPHNISEITKERLRRVAKKLGGEKPMFASDCGFRVFKLASSNIQAWQPDLNDLPKTLEESVEHLKTDRTEQDILFELLLKLGLDLTVPIERKTIAKKTVHNIGAGTLLVCLAEQIAAAEVEPLALGIVAWHKGLNPAGETTVVLRDGAFADDVGKTNLTAILQQHGLENVRSL